MSLFAGLELSLLFVCIWGFIAVLLTGQFKMLVIVGCIAALCIGYRVRRGGWRPSLLVANTAAILVFLISGVIYLVTFNLLIATVYLFLFLQVTKYITRQKLIESRWCYLISLFNIIGASVITTGITFGLMLVAYVFLALVSLRLYVMAREWESSMPAESHSVAMDQRLRLTKNRKDDSRISNLTMPKRLFLSSSFLTVVIMLIAGGIFSAIPRLATQNLFQTYGPPQEDPAVSAFSENVEFGAFTEIQLDNAVALFVQPQGSTRPSHVRMRGVALDTFDGKAWSRTGPSISQNHTYEFGPLFTTRLYQTMFVHRVIQPPGITNFLFGDSFPTSIAVPPAFPFYVDRMAQTVYLADMPPKEFQYDVASMHETLSLRRDPTTMGAFHRPASHLTLQREPTEEESATAGGIPDNSNPNDFETSGASESRPNEASGGEPWRLFFKDATTTRSDETTEIRRRDRYDPDGDNEPRAERGWRRSWRDDDEVTTDTDDFHWWRYRRGRTIRRTPQEILHDYLSKCLALPDTLSSGRVADLARQWTEDKETTFAKAIEVERRLRTDYGYSLTPNASGNYIESFLFDVREGHCEYFATSMAVLLRNAGIPARVVNGYYSTEWNNLSGMYTVRQKDAHSWVEAWLGDNYGWMTFDPTPAGGVARRVDRGVIIENLSRISDAIRMRWYRYVVDYSFTDQMMTVRRLLEWRRNFMLSLKKMDILGISSDDKRQIELGEFTREIDWRPIAIAAVIIFLLLFWQGARWIRRRRVQRYSPVKYYDKLLRLLARHGLSIKPGQTPREFAREVALHKESLGDFTEITEKYYANRFHEQPADPETAGMVSRFRQELRRKRKQ